MDLGLLIIRIIIGAELVIHGLQWLCGWFGGAGLSKGAKVFEQWGLRPAKLMVLTAGLAETGAGIALAVGAFTPLAATGAAATMAIAGLTLQTSSGSLWNTKGGGEFPFVLAGVCGAVGVMGAGAFSVDASQAANSVFWAWLAVPPWWFVILMAGMIFVAVLPFAGLVSRNRAPAGGTPGAPAPAGGTPAPVIPPPVSPPPRPGTPGADPTGTP